MSLSRERGEPSVTRFVQQSPAEGLTLNVMGDIDSMPGLINLVRAGFPTILPRYVVRDAIKDGSIHPIEITRPALEWTVHLASRHDTTRPRASLATGRLLLDICADMTSSGIWPGTTVQRG